MGHLSHNKLLGDQVDPFANVNEPQLVTTINVVFIGNNHGLCRWFNHYRWLEIDVSLLWPPWQVGL